MIKLEEFTRKDWINLAKILDGGVEDNFLLRIWNRLFWGSKQYCFLCDKEFYFNHKHIIKL